MEPEVRSMLVGSLAKVLGVAALLAFGTGYWYLALPAAGLAALCLVQLRRWSHGELEERARLAEAPTDDEEEPGITWDADGGVASDPGRDPRPDAPR
jgi:hypothetical protein